MENFGCRATQADGAAIERQLLERGLERAAIPGQAEVVVLNTCTVTASADQDVRAAVRRQPCDVGAAPHDRAAAAISHLPYLFAVTLMDTVSRDADEVTWSMAASGFRDTSRLAASDATMMLDIIQSNHAEVLKVLGDAQTVWQELLASP